MMKVLYIDIEGGWGGSSRSLYYLVRYLDRNRYEPVVLLGKRGPAQQRYRRDGVPTYLFSPIPRTTALRSNHLGAAFRFLLELIHLPRLLVLLRRLIRRDDIRLIHLNHESLFVIGWCCKRLFRVKVVCHVRTMLPRNRWAQWQVRILARTADHLIFITENERARWHALWPESLKTPQTIVYNVAVTDGADGPSERLRSVAGTFKVISLMTLSYVRGVDRLVDVAAWLKRLGDVETVFVICGRTDDQAFVNGIKRRIRARGLQDRFLFLGYQTNPEALLAECDALIRPSREQNPWGRDVIEALVHGKPVIATGTYQGFVEDGVNGFLWPAFDPVEMAGRLVYLRTHPEIREAMARRNRDKGLRLFDGPEQAARIERIYAELMAQPSAAVRVDAQTQIVTESPVGASR